MENKLANTIIAIAAGGIAYKAFTKLRERKLQKEMYQAVETIEVVTDEVADKE